MKNNYFYSLKENIINLLAPSIILILAACVPPQENSQLPINPLNQTMTVNDLLNVPINQIYSTMPSNNTITNESSDSHHNQENSLSPNTSTYLTSATALIDLPAHLLKNHFEGRLETSLKRDITKEYDITWLDLSDFSIEKINSTITQLLGDNLVIEVDPPLPDIEELSNEHANFLTVSSRMTDNPDYLVDGIKDDSEIQEALTQVWRNGGGMVFLYPGTYHIGTQLLVWDNTTLKGSGRVGNRKTIIKLHNNSENLKGKTGIIRMKKDFEPISFDKRVNHATIEDFIIDGNRYNQKQNVSDNEKKYGYYGEGYYLTIRRITSRNCQGYGYDPHASEDTKPTKYMLIEDSYAHHNFKDGFTLDMVQESRFVNNVAENNDRHGFNVITHAREVIIADSITRHNKGAGIKVQNGTHSITFINNQINNNAQEGIYIRSSNDNQFINNIIAQNKKHAIRITGGRYNHFIENFIGINSTLAKNEYPAIMINDYNGFYHRYPVPSIAVNNIFEKNIFILKNERAVIEELDDTMWNIFKENTLWSKQKTNFILSGEESRSTNNFIYYQDQ